MKHYKVTYLEDTTDCETCGMSFAMGYIVECPDGEVLERIPHAACYDEEDYAPEEAINFILNKEKIIVEEEYRYD